ncbi:MAG: hypothetical protein OXH09_21815 [Gammaproteobacteria bacterium]|nr:hypothetical protein [Gammaproteobacteria bacterium]
MSNDTAGALNPVANIGALRLKSYRKGATDVCEYPDSGKFGVGTHLGELAFRFIGRAEDSRDHWDGEPDAQD